MIARLVNYPRMRACSLVLLLCVTLYLYPLAPSRAEPAALAGSPRLLRCGRGHCPRGAPAGGARARARSPINFSKFSAQVSGGWTPLSLLVRYPAECLGGLGGLGGGGGREGWEWWNGRCGRSRRRKRGALYSSASRGALTAAPRLGVDSSRPGWSRRSPWPPVASTRRGMGAYQSGIGWATLPCGRLD